MRQLTGGGSSAARVIHPCSSNRDILLLLKCFLSESLKIPPFPRLWFLDLWQGHLRLGEENRQGMHFSYSQMDVPRAVPRAPNKPNTVVHRSGVKIDFILNFFVSH